MNRDFDRPDVPERPNAERTPDLATVEITRIEKELSPVSDAPRSVYELRDRKYQLNSNEGRMLMEIGRFRSIEKKALLIHIYGGNKELFERDLTHLHRNNLVRIVGPKHSLNKYVVLTKPAKELAQNHFRDNPKQELYAEAVKPREIKHDGALFRLYEKAAEQSRERGGKPTRVILDFEFKRRINRDIAKARLLPKNEYARHLQATAQRENLKVVRGKIPLPDVRIEYETSEGTLSVCDLELINENYRAPFIAEKRAAGFHLYSINRKGRPAFGPALLGEILFF